MLVAVGTAACGSTAPNYPGATVPTAIVGEPYAVPAVITKPYVQKVLNALEAVNAQAARLIIARKSLVPAAIVDLESVDTPAELQAQEAVLRQESSAGFANFRSNPGLVHDSVTKILFSSPTCVYLAATRDYSQVEVHPPPLHTSYFALDERIASNQPDQPNPTPWVIAFLGYNSNGTVPRNPCMPA